MKECVKLILKSSLIGKKIYPLAQQVYRFYANPIKRARLQRLGVALFKELDRVMSQNGVAYFADYGTLLGIVREHAFIRTDDDIDVTVLQHGEDPKRILSFLLDAGFEFVHAIVYNNKIVVFTVSWSGLPVDIYITEDSPHEGFSRYTGARYCPDVKYESSDQNNCISRDIIQVNAVKYVDFCGIKVPVPVNAEELLEFEYGQLWRIPDAKCKNATDAVYVERPGYALRVLDVSKLI